MYELNVFLRALTSSGFSGLISSYLLTWLLMTSVTVSALTWTLDTLVTLAPSSARTIEVDMPIPPCCGGSYERGRSPGGGRRKGAMQGKKCVGKQNRTR